MRPVWRAARRRRAGNARRAQPCIPRGMFRMRGVHATTAERPTVRGQSRRRSTVLPHRFRKGNIPNATDRRQPATR